MDFKIIWADSALADLENICSYLSQATARAEALRSPSRCCRLIARKSTNLHPSKSKLPTETADTRNPGTD
jgi:hypothetical protein